MESSSTITPRTRPPFSSSPSKSRQISAAIKGENCPICLNQISGHCPAVISKCMHAYCLRCLLRWSHYKRTCPLCNARFHSYFSTSSPSSSSSSFRLHHLIPLSFPSSPIPRHARADDVIRSLRRRRWRWRPEPPLRSFGRGGSAPSEVITERILQWRASIYRNGLKAVRSPCWTHHGQNMSFSREQILHRIEPWIRRELQAILQDPDPTIIVHVATSVYLSRIDNKTGPLSMSNDDEGAFLNPLRRFLDEWTDIFWHELRCFAECTFTMDTYDEVVQYRQEN